MAEAADPCSSNSDSSHTSDTSDREHESTGGILSEGRPSTSTEIVRAQSRGLLRKTQRAMAEQDELNSSCDEQYTTANSSDEEPEIRSGRYDRSGLPTMEKLVQTRTSFHKVPQTTTSQVQASNTDEEIPCKSLPFEEDVEVSSLVPYSTAEPVRAGKDLVRTKGKRQKKKKGEKYILTQPPLQGSQKEERNRSEGIFEQTKDVSEDENYEGKKVDKELHQCLDPAPDRKSQSCVESLNDIKSKKIKRDESKHAAKKREIEGKDEGERKINVEYRKDSEDESICVEAAKPKRKRKRNVSSISGTASNEHHSIRQSDIKQIPTQRKGGYIKSRSMTRTHRKPESERKKRKKYRGNISASSSLQLPTPSKRMKMQKQDEMEHESSSKSIAKGEAHHSSDDEGRPKKDCKHGDGSVQGKLTSNDLGLLVNELDSVASLCHNFGLQLGVKNADISIIDRDNKGDSRSQLRNILDQRLKQEPPLTWQDVVTALRADSVREYGLASKVESMHIPPLHPPAAVAPQVSTDSSMSPGTQCVSSHASLQPPLPVESTNQSPASPQATKEPSVPVHSQSPLTTALTQPARRSPSTSPEKINAVTPKKERIKRKGEAKYKVKKGKDKEQRKEDSEDESICVEVAELKRKRKRKVRREAHHSSNDERRPKEHEYMSSSDITSESEDTDDGFKIEFSKKHHKRKQKSSSGSSESSISSSSSYSKYDKRKHSMRRKPISKGRTKRKKQVAIYKKKKQYFKHGGKKGKGKMKQHKTVCSSSGSSASDSGSSSKVKHEQFQREDGRSLRNVFRCQFGKLCSVITDPLNLATHLREKGLISSSMMDKVLTTPNSQQEKAILLMCALERRIKSNPDNLFIFIEILMENIVLQEDGKEMWKKAGEVCPVKAAAKFGSILPPTDTEEKGNTDEDERIKSDRVDQCASTSIKMCVVSVGETSNEPSVLVHVSQVAVHVSPVMQKYKRYLQSVYQARDLAPADKYLPTLKSKYINLAMVSKEMCSRNERDMFTQATLYGGVDAILNEKSPITMAELMIPEEGKGPVTFILVEGPPGIGKSTFAWELCRRWDEILELREYHAVVLIKLREKWALNATSLSELLRYPADPEISKHIARELDESQGKNLVFVLDGFDEVSHSVHEKSVLNGILRKEVLPECSIILTTRPSAHSILEETFQPKVNKHIEIIGFTEEERVKYITEVFSDEHEIQRNFLKYMFKVPHIKSMMYIPLNCAIITKVYHEFQFHKKVIPKTITQLYKALTHSLLLRYLKSKKTSVTFPSGCSMLPECLNDDEMMEFKVLAKFAFESYHDNVGRKITFFEEDMPRGMSHFGFMNESTELYASRGMERTFTFLHLSLQEYLAAWHLANSCSVECQVVYHAMATIGVGIEYEINALKKYTKGNMEATELVSKFLPILHKLSLVEPAKFLAGITGFGCQSMDHGSTLWESYLDFVKGNFVEVLFYSLFEAQNPLICSRVFSTGIRFYQKPYDYYVFSYCISHCSSEYSVPLSYDSSSYVELFVTGLQDHWKLTGSPRALNLSLIYNGWFPPSERDEDKRLLDSLRWLLEAPNSFLIAIKGIYIQFPPVNNCSSVDTALTDLLQKSLSLNTLIIRHPTLSRHTWEWGVGVISSFNNLNVLHLEGIQCSSQQADSICGLIETTLTELKLHIVPPSNVALDAVLEKILKSVLLSKKMNTLWLYNLSRLTMKSMQTVLLQCPCLEVLRLFECALGYDGILFLCSALLNNTTLKILSIHDKRTKYVHRGKFDAKIVQWYDKKEVLPLSTNTTTSVLVELNNILKTNCTLINLSIHSGVIQNLLAGTLCKAPHEIRELAAIPCFNAERLISGITPKLKRSYSTSDLLQHTETVLFSRGNWWDTPCIQSAGMEIEQRLWTLTDSMKQHQHNLLSLRVCNPAYRHHWDAIFKQMFLKRCKQRNLARPSFTAPDTDLLQPLSHLDPRLQDCLGVTDIQRRNVTDELCKKIKNLFIRSLIIDREIKNYPSLNIFFSNGNRL